MFIVNFLYGSSVPQMKFPLKEMQKPTFAKCFNEIVLNNTAHEVILSLHSLSLESIETIAKTKGLLPNSELIIQHVKHVKMVESQALQVSQGKERLKSQQIKIEEAETHFAAASKLQLQNKELEKQTNEELSRLKTELEQTEAECDSLEKQVKLLEAEKIKNEELLKAQKITLETLKQLLKTS